MPKNLYPDGWLAPDGAYHECLGMRHMNWGAIAPHETWADEYIEKSGKTLPDDIHTNADYLEYLGWIKIQDKTPIIRWSIKGPYADNRCNQRQYDALFDLQLFEGFNIELELWELI